MKFFLTIYICSIIEATCIVPMQKPYIYPKVYDTHYECVRSGLSDSYEIIFAEKFFDKERVNQYKLYPSFICEELPVSGA